MKPIPQIQLGKNKITDNFISTLKDHFKKNENVRVSVLKNALPEKKKKQEVKTYADEILGKLGKNFTARVIGHTIMLKKWRKNIRQ